MYRWQNLLKRSVLHCVLVQCMDSRLLSPPHPSTGKKKQLTGWKSNCGGVVSNLSNTKDGNWPYFHMSRTEVKLLCMLIGSCVMWFLPHACAKQCVLEYLQLNDVSHITWCLVSYLSPQTPQKYNAQQSVLNKLWGV